MMVRSSYVIGVQKSDGRFLGRGTDQRPFLKWEHDRAGRAQVEIFSVEMFPVRRSIAIHQMQVSEIEKHHGIAEEAGGGINRSVGGLRVDTFRTAHHAAPPPGSGRPSGTREKFDGALRWVL